MIVYSAILDNDKNMHKNIDKNIDNKKIYSEKNVKKLLKNYTKLNYKNKKINQLLLELYNNIFHILRLKLDFDFILNVLIKIVSKGDIFIINKFLDDLKKKNETKDKLVQILEHQ